MESNKKELRVGIIGHVDHGNTTLIAALQQAIENRKSEVLIIAPGATNEEMERIKDFNDVKTLKLTAPPILPDLTGWSEYYDGKSNRNKRRQAKKKKRKKR